LGWHLNIIFPKVVISDLLNSPPENVECSKLPVQQGEGRAESWRIF
jgi:hypothetical protein